MSVITPDYLVPPDVVAAARKFIRSEGDRVVSICQLLDELCDMFGDRFPVSPDTYHIDQVPNTGSIEFAGNGKRVDEAPATGLTASLLGCVQIPSAPLEVI